MKLEGSIREEYGRAADALDAMNDLHRAWAGFQPLAPLNRSDMMTLGAVAGMTRKGRTVTVSLLAHAMHQSLPGISQKVSGLEELGYLRRVPDKSDRRVSCIQLTEAGGQLADKGLRHFLGRVEQALDTLGAEKADTLMALMRELSAAIRDVQAQDEAEKDESPV